jgi:hypothetical protein
MTDAEERLMRGIGRRLYPIVSLAGMVIGFYAVLGIIFAALLGLKTLGGW